MAVPLAISSCHVSLLCEPSPQIFYLSAGKSWLTSPSHGPGWTQVSTVPYPPRYIVSLGGLTRRPTCDAKKLGVTHRQRPLLPHSQDSTRSGKLTVGYRIRNGLHSEFFDEHKRHVGVSAARPVSMAGGNVSIKNRKAEEDRDSRDWEDSGANEERAEMNKEEEEEEEEDEEWEEWGEEQADRRGGMEVWDTDWNTGRMGDDVAASELTDGESDVDSQDLGEPMAELDESSLRFAMLESLVQCSRGGDIRGAEKVLRELGLAGLMAGPRAYHGVVVAYTREGDMEGAFDVLRRMLSSEVQPLQESCIAIARLCGSKGQVAKGEALLGLMEGLQQDIRVTWLTLIGQSETRIEGGKCTVEIVYCRNRA